MPETRAQARARKSIFPFLKLPPELRDEIYVLVLGSRVIHTEEFSTETPGIVKLCALPMDQNEAHLPGLVPPNPLRGNFSDRHKLCNKHPGNELTLTLLLTCRQIQTEARYVPFGENIFTFRCRKSFFRYMKRIGDARAARLRDVLFYSANHHRPWSHGARELASLPLHGLRTVRVFLELCAADFEPDIGNHRMLRFTTVDGERDVFVGLRGLPASRIRRVKVVIDRYMPQGVVVSDKVPAASTLEAWIGRIEDMLGGGKDNEVQSATDPQLANGMVEVDP